MTNLIVNGDFANLCGAAVGRYCISTDNTYIAPWVVDSCSVVAAAGCMTGQFEVENQVFTDSFSSTNIDLNPNGPSAIFQDVIVPAGYIGLTLTMAVGFNTNCRPATSGAFTLAVKNLDAGTTVFTTSVTGSMPFAHKTISIPTTNCGSTRVEFISLVPSSSCGPLLTNVQLVVTGAQGVDTSCVGGLSVIPSITTTSLVTTSSSTTPPTTTEPATTAPATTAPATTAPATATTTLLTTANAITPPPTTSPATTAQTPTTSVTTVAATTVPIATALASTTPLALAPATTALSMTTAPAVTPVILIVLPATTASTNAATSTTSTTLATAVTPTISTTVATASAVRSGGSGVTVTGNTLVNSTLNVCIQSITVTSAGAIFTDNASCGDNSLPARLSSVLGTQVTQLQITLTCSSSSTCQLSVNGNAYIYSLPANGGRIGGSTGGSMTKPNIIVGSGSILSAVSSELAAIISLFVF
ncbi:hypothetical protein HDU98_003250 [Podochytrium sp. JEL0797]|nr:hypothetical protein HDU98_003250 [Podochytrium sp. JEL0797]